MKKKLTVKVVVDTNVIHIDSSNDLLRSEIINLIKVHSLIKDINIIWFIPEIVIKERIFQMRKIGEKLLPSIEKIEKLLGHNLHINEEIIESRINENVAKQIKQYNLNVLKIDTSMVDWELIISKSINRFAPFEDSPGKEKWFRDALILECLKQLKKLSPTTKSNCRIIFITKDLLLNRAAVEFSTSCDNIEVYSDIDELDNLINIISSDNVSEDLISSVSVDAEKLFFEKGNKDTFYYTAELRDEITNTFTEELNRKTSGTDTRERWKWCIAKPVFEKKIKQKIFWKTIIEVDFTDYETTFEINSFSGNDWCSWSVEGQQPINSETVSYSSWAITWWNTGYSGGIYRPNSGNYVNDYNPLSFYNPRKKKVKEGKIKFEVTWSVILTMEKKIKNPKLEWIKCLWVEEK